MTVTGTFTVESPWPPDQAHAFLSDLARFDEWDPGTKAARQVHGDGPAVDARYELVAGRLTMDYEIEELRPGHVRACGTHRLVRSVDQIDIEPAGTGSRISYRADLTLLGMAKVAEPLLAWKFSSMTDEAAEGMARATDGARVA